MTSIQRFYLSVVISIAATINATGQEAERYCCSVIDIEKDSGTVIIRSERDGWITAFKPAALEFAELSIGDSVHASFTTKHVSKVKTRLRVYPFLQPDYGAPCCEILANRGEGQTREITGRTNEGDSIKFMVPDTLALKFANGGKVYTSPTHGFAMVLNDVLKDSSLMLFYGFPMLPKEQQ